MATGTISQTQFSLRQVIDHACRRCRLPAQAITGEMIDVARDVLYLMLSDWANNNIQLWCVQKLVLPMYEAQAQLLMPLGTVDVLNANIRNMTYVTGTVTQTPSSASIQFTSPTQVTTVGLTWNDTAVPLTFSLSNDGINWTVVGTDTPNAIANQRSWSDVDGAPASLYFRVVATGALNVSNIMWGNNPTEITIARLNRDDYINLPNKVFQGRPLQYWFDRQRDQPIMTLWPTPNVTFAQQQQIVVWRKRYIMDLGSSQETIDIPQRWYEAVIANLASRLAVELSEVAPDLMPVLEAKATMALLKAQAEERDSARIQWAPNLSVYTR